FVQLADTEARACTFGSTDPDAVRIALIGDSHAYQYIEALIVVAETRGWSLTTYLKGACPWTTAPVGTLALGATDSCSPWRANVADALAAEDAFDAVVTTALATTPYRVSSEQRDRVVTEGFIDAWRQVGEARIVVIADNPVFSVDPNKCLKVSIPSECTEPRSFALADVDGAAHAALVAGAELIDFTDRYCTVEVCRSVVNGANVYRDKDHLTNTFVLTMVPAVSAALDRALARD
ncbi:MAG: acyltransferase, partial [Cryobacterium sp.]|nr:acyltransferase [Cryobacterium sp.]